MLNVKPTVYAAFSGDTVLTAMLPGGLHADVCPEAGTYPSMTYSEISNIPILHSDNAEQVDKATIQVGIMVASGSTSEIAARVDMIMRGLGFFREFSGDLNDGNIKIKTMRYVIGGTA